MSEYLTKGMFVCAWQTLRQYHSIKGVFLPSLMCGMCVCVQLTHFHNTNKALLSVSLLHSLMCFVFVCIQLTQCHNTNITILSVCLVGLKKGLVNGGLSLWPMIGDKGNTIQILADMGKCVDARTAWSAEMLCLVYSIFFYFFAAKISGQQSCLY